MVASFYDFHRDLGKGPLMNPVPVSEARRRALAHRNPAEAMPAFRRSRLRQRVPATEPRAIPNAMWDEFFAALNHDRDRAAVLLCVSSGARASELLGVTPADVDWPAQIVYVVSKGTKLREPIPASPQVLVVLAAYTDAMGMPTPHEPVFRTRRGPDKPLTYWAMRRVIQRTNGRLGTNWSLHDLRHTAAERMANDPNLTLAEVRAILRHADPATTGRYLHARVEDLFDAPRPTTTGPASSPASRRATTRTTSRRCSVAGIQTFTARNRRTDYNGDEPFVPAPVTRFAGAELKAAPAPLPSTPPGPFGDLSRAPASEILRIVERTATGRPNPGRRRKAVRRTFSLLEEMPGDTWQERWLASGFGDEGAESVRVLARGGDRVDSADLIAGIKLAFCLRVIRPSISGFRANKFLD